MLRSRGSRTSIASPTSCAGTVIKPHARLSINSLVGPRTTAKGLRRRPRDRGRQVRRGRRRRYFAVRHDAVQRRVLRRPRRAPSIRATASTSAATRTAARPRSTFRTPTSSSSNNTDYGVLVWPTYTGTSLTVTLYSTKYAPAPRPARPSQEGRVHRGQDRAHPHVSRRHQEDRQVPRDVSPAGRRELRRLGHAGDDHDATESTTTTTTRPPTTTTAPAAAEHHAVHRLDRSAMRVAVTGSSGLIGSALVESLTATASRCIRLVRRRRRRDESPVGPDRPATSTPSRSTASTRSCTSPAKASPRSAGPTRRSSKLRRLARSRHRRRSRRRAPAATNGPRCSCRVPRSASTATPATRWSTRSTARGDDFLAGLVPSSGRPRPRRPKRQRSPRRAHPHRHRAIAPRRHARPSNCRCSSSASAAGSARGRHWVSWIIARRRGPRHPLRDRHRQRCAAR